LIPGAADATTSLITAAPTSIVADGATTSTITVQLKDAFSNNLDSGGDTVVLATDLGTLGSVTDNSNGTYTATFTSATTTGTATITGTVNAAAITNTETVTLIPGAADGTTSLITAAPTTIVADGVETSTITVQLKDAFSNLLISGGDTVVLTTDLGTMGSVTDNGDGTYTAILTSATTTGTSTVTGTVNAVEITDTATVTLKPGDPAKVAFSVQPSDTTSTESISPAIKVQVQDQYSNLVTTVTDFITLAFGTNAGSPAGILSGIRNVAAVSGEATFSDISIDKVGVGYTLTASSGDLASATSASFEIKVGAPVQLAFSVEPSNTDATLPITPAIKVQVQDAGGNQVPTATDSITLAIGNNPGPGTLSGNFTVAAVSGEATFSDISIAKAASGYTLTADNGVFPIVTSAAFTINVGVPAQLVYIVQPTDATSTEAISPAIQVQVLDAGANLVTSATTSVTLVIGTNPGGGTLSGTWTVAANSGVATFSDISIDKVGVGYALVTSATDLTSATSDVFDINIGLPAQLAFSVQPFDTEVRLAITPTVKVQVHDAGGNRVSTALNAITLAIGTNPGSGTLSGTLIIPAVAGEVAYSGISIDKVGVGYKLTASYGGLPTITSVSFDITDTLVTTIDTGTSVIQTDIANLQVNIEQSITQATAGIAKDVAEIKKDTADIKKDTGTSILGKLDALESSVTSILEDTSTNIPEQLSSIEDLKETGSAKILNRPTTIKRGETISIQFQTESGLSPTLNLYDPDSKQLVTDAVMTEIGTTGIYKYELEIDGSLPLGDYTILVTESERGDLDSMGLTVAETDLASIGSEVTDLTEDISGIGTDVSSIATGVTDLKADIESVQEAAIGAQSQATRAASAASAARKIIEEVRDKLKEQAEGGAASPVVELMAQLQTALQSIREAALAPQRAVETGLSSLDGSIKEISELLKAVSSENGVNLDTMYESLDETSSDVTEIKDKVERLKVMLELNKEIAEKVLERAPPKKAVIKTWFETG
jgi:outer membrane murein-binding lipoprotein Lpp